VHLFVGVTRSDLFELESVFFQTTHEFKRIQDGDSKLQKDIPSGLLLDVCYYVMGHLISS